MKGINLMKTKITFVPLCLRASLFSLALLAILSCEQPFRAGLGSVVDIRPPSVTLETPGAGAYLWGIRPFMGRAEDDYKIDRVDFMVTNLSSDQLEAGEDATETEKLNIAYRKELSTWKQVTFETSSQNKGKWNLDIDTTKFADGDLKVRIRATDSAGKTAVTDEIVFLVRNEPPAITVAAPYIARGDEPGDIGGIGHLNYGTLRSLPLSSIYPRKMDAGSVISGTISYDEDIYTGERKIEEGVERYPPQIRIWPISETPAEGEFAPGTWPTLEQAPWQDFTYTGNQDTDNLFALSVGSYQFTWNVPPAGRYYGFEIRAQSKKLRDMGEPVKFRYPRDYWPSVTDIQGEDSWDNPASTADANLVNFLVENRYVLIYVKEQSTLPVVELYKLEDLSSWNAEGYYNTLVDENGIAINDNMAHPYVNKLIVSKNGSFTLRVKTTHPEGISSAEVYWEKEGIDQPRGRFIWDPASGVNTVNPYSQWGTLDINQRSDPTRNFIFTYEHGKNNSLPNTTAYHQLIRGKSKVQIYSGPIDDWSVGKRDGRWPARTVDLNPGTNNPTWTDLYTLEEGVYNIEIYVRSAYYTGDVFYAPHTNTIRLDRGPPDAEITTIDGAYELGLTESEPYTIVNGVVQPRMRFVDGRPEDSGLRTATDPYHQRPNGTYGFDQRYLLVQDDGKNMMDIINENGGSTYWPPYPVTPATADGDTTTIPGVKIFRDGPVFDSTFKFKSSKIYGDDVTEDALADGEYWLYVFVRDNAYNVGHSVPLRVTVDKYTDKPGIEFMGAINDSVIDPDPDADYPRDTDGKGFVISTNGIRSERNRFGQNSSLRLRLFDDDSLDLGMAGADLSKVKVTLSASRHTAETPQDPLGTIQALSDVDSKYLITLTDTQVKNIFSPQQAGAYDGRQAIRSREGTISQSALLDSLKNWEVAGDKVYQTYGLFDIDGQPNPTAFTSLPDGIYQIAVTIDDYAPAKLKLDTDLNPAKVADALISIWIFVDTANPELDVVYPGTGSELGWIAPEDGLGTGVDGIIIRGNLSDRNGPITVEVFEITCEGAKPDNWEGNVWADKDDVDIKRDQKYIKLIDPNDLQEIPEIVPNVDTKQYVASFAAPVHINRNVSANFVITLTVKDRFGRLKTYTQRNKIDKEPPTVGLRKQMDAFERRDNSRMVASDPGTSGDKFTRLANGVVSFNISASDNLRVREVRYWLLPSTEEFPTVKYDPLNPNDPTVAWNYTGALVAEDTTTTDGRRGKLSDDFSRTIYIDTKLLDDNTEYRLYIMAQDDVPNTSELEYIKDNQGVIITPLVVKPQQEIYVLQQEDKPWFRSNNLDNAVVGEKDMKIRMVINDDDGFADAAAAQNARADSVKIWMKSGSGLAGTDDIYNDGDLTTRGFTGPVTIAPTAMPLSGSKNISLNIDLLDYATVFPNVLGSPLIDGDKYYIVEATDSWFGKFGDEFGAATTETKSWRKEYSFTLDSTDPVINISYPSGTPVFGADAHNATPLFNVTGSITDARLKTYINPSDPADPKNGSYIIGIRLDGTALYYTTPPTSSSFTPFVLGAGVKDYPSTGDNPDSYITAIKTSLTHPTEDPPIAEGDTKVEFSIPADAFTAAIGYNDSSPTANDGIKDGNHTLVFTTEDRGGKTGTFTLNFAKDKTPPDFAFTTPGFALNTKNLRLNTMNGSTDNWWPTIINVNSWNNTAKTSYIDGTALLPNRGIKLPVITYETGDVPSITGTITDASSNVDKTSLNITWDNSTTSQLIPVGQIDGEGRSVQWRVYLTTTGTPTGTILTDGIHTIRLSFKDSAGNERTVPELWGFRINKALPEAKITSTTEADGKIFGDRAGDTDTVVFTMSGTGMSRNLSDVQVSIKHSDSNTTPFERSVFDLLTLTESNWTFASTGTVPLLDVTETLTWTLPIKREYVLKAGGIASPSATSVIPAGTYEVTVTAFDIAGKKSEEAAISTYTFKVDPNVPEFTINNVRSTAGDTTPDYWLGAAGRERPTVFSSDPSIKGRVTDASNIIDVQLQLARWNYNTSTWETYDFAATPTWAAANDVWRPMGGIATSLDVTSGATTVLPETEFTINEWKFTHVDGTNITMPNGYYRVRLRARDESTIAGDSAGWTATNNGNPTTYDYAYFFIDNTPPVVTTPDTQTTYNSRSPVPFTFSATDNNLFEKMVISVARAGTSTGGTLPADVTVPNPKRTGDITVAWAPTTHITFNANLPDDSYKIVCTVTDLAGKVTSISRTIMLDNTPPTANIEDPLFYGTIPKYDEDGTKITPETIIHRFASAGDIKIGGEEFTIKGTTDDTSANGSASGPAEIWYHVGYGTQTALPTGTTSQDIMRWAIDASTVLATGTVDTGEANNTAFDTAARGLNGSLWFKYTTVPQPGTTATGAFDAPNGFNAIASPDVRKWALTAHSNSATGTVARNYAVDSIVIRGTTYTDGANGTQYLARSITETELPLNMRRGGLYSLPLVIRVVDNAGNVFYALRDIWIYPNGDNPSTVIINPSKQSTGYTNGDSARGGQINIEGSASDNVSVRSVIFRIKTDATESEGNTYFDANGNHILGTAPGDSDIFTFPVLPAGVTAWDGTGALNTVWNNFNITDVSGTGTLSKTGWYIATLDSPRDTSTSWSFRLNAEQEITNLIATKGFRYPSTAAAPNIIRVWLEVFVFDSSSTLGTDPNWLMSLGLNNNVSTHPRPYVREFYFTASAPEVRNYQISNQGSTTAFSGYGSNATEPVAPIADNYIRGGNFAIRADLDGKDADIGQISVRLPNDTNEAVRQWQPVYVRADATVENPNLAFKSVNGVSLGTWTGATRTATITYTFDSTRAASTAALQAVRGGAWAQAADIPGGKYTIDVRVRDANSPPAEDIYSFEVGIDNSVPRADTSKYITPRKVAGTNATFLGRAFDYTGSPNNPQPPYKAIKEIHVWFTDRNNTQYINMATGARTAQASVGRTQYTGVYTSPVATVTYNGDDVTNITKSGTLASASRYIPNEFTTTNPPVATNYVKVLSETPQTGVTWSPSNNWDIFWSFQQDTTKLGGDGWITMHYVVVDQTNNRSYYTQSMVVMNNYPEITKVTLYTDNTGSGAVFTTHDGNDAFSEYDIPERGKNALAYTDAKGVEVGEYIYRDGYLRSGFISKNKVVGFGIESLKGNPQLHYQARYVERYKVPLTTANLTAMANRTGNLAFTTETNGVASPQPANTFVNLYTIVDEQAGGVTAAIWQLLGVRYDNPIAGTHFVVRPAAGDLFGGTTGNWTTTANYPDAYVYAYRQITKATTDVAVRYDTNANTVAPANLNFNGDTRFGGAGSTGIPTAKAKSTANAYNPVANPSATQRDDAANGTAYFLIKMWDSVDGGVNHNTETGLYDDDMLYDAIVIGMGVYVDDTTNPVARLYDLNPYTELDVVGGNSSTAFQTRTRNNAASPGTADTGFGMNVLRGGLYNLGTADSPIKSGYIDPRDSSTALNPYVNKPNDPENPYTGSAQKRPDNYINGDAPGTGTTNRDKVSGSVFLRGLAWDDQLIDEIQITVDSVVNKTILKLWYVTTNADGTYTKFTTNTPSAAQITANNLTRKMMPETDVTAWTYEEIDWRTGHTVEWVYLWNTEAEPGGRNRGGPLENRKVAVRVRDMNSRPGPAVTDRLANVEYPAIGAGAAVPPTTFHNTVNVDIVPYVTGFKRADKFATNRSRQGWYSFYQGETNIRVLGYNLGNTVNNAAATTGTTIYLNSTGAADAVAMRLGDNTVNTRSYAATANGASPMPNDGHIFAIGANSTSGKLNVSVGGVVTTPTNNAWNHQSSQTNKSWNTDKSDNVSGSDLWTSKLFAHIWRTTESNTSPATYFGDNTSDGGSWGMDSPSMVLEYGTSSGTSGETTGNGSSPGRLHGAWGIREKFGVYYGANDNGGRIRQQTAQDPLSYTDMAYYPGTNNANNLTVVYTYQWDALPNLLLRTHVKYLADGNALGNNPGGTIAPFLIARNDRNFPTDTRRWQNIRTSMAAANQNRTGGTNPTRNEDQYAPHDNNNYNTPNNTATRGDAGRVYTVGYDSAGNVLSEGRRNLFFVERVDNTNYPTTNTVSGSGSTPNNANGLPLFVDGGNASGGSGLGVAQRVGNWSAVDYYVGTSGTPRPVIAYYDESNDTLRLAYGTNTTTNNGAIGDWTRRYVFGSGTGYATLDTSNPLARGSGKYVSIKVEKVVNNVERIHLAFYNSTQQTVVYAVGTLTGAFKAYTVDKVITGGVWTDISVDNNGNPFIVYGDSSRIGNDINGGNYDGVRIAYRDTTRFTRTTVDPLYVAGDTDSQGWEAVTMPADYTVAGDRLNIEAWPPTGRGGVTPTRTATGIAAWDAAVGYAGTGGPNNARMFRIGYFFKPAFTWPQ